MQMKYIMEILDKDGFWNPIDNFMHFEHAIYYQQNAEYTFGIATRLIYL